MKKCFLIVASIVCLAVAVSFSGCVSDVSATTGEGSSEGELSEPDHYSESENDPETDTNTVCGIEKDSDLREEISNATDSVENSESVSSELYTETVEQNNPVDCKHVNTHTLGISKATCVAEGYTGDVKCVDCGVTVSYGVTVAKTAVHASVITQNAKIATEAETGYTGDDVCSACGTIVKKGTVIDRIAPEISYYTYTNSYGDTITLPEGVDVFDYTLEQSGKTATSDFADIEAEIFRLVNVERQKAGLAPCENKSSAYYFVKTRAMECIESYSHTRPNGDQWISVYAEEGVFFGSAAENLEMGKGFSPESIAQADVEGWMNSSAHRENILDPDYTSMSIAVVYIEETGMHYTAQHFFGN